MFALKYKQKTREFWWVNGELESTVSFQDPAEAALHFFQWNCLKGAALVTEVPADYDFIFPICIMRVVGQARLDLFLEYENVLFTPEELLKHTDI